MDKKEMANRLVNMFGSVKKAQEYVILWQDEYTSEKDRIFRQEVKIELSTM